MMVNCLSGMVDQQKALNHISSQDHCKRSSPMRISNMLQGEFEPAQNLSSGLVEWSCAVVITTTPQCYRWLIMTVFCKFLLKRFILNIMISNVIIKCHWHNVLWKVYMGIKSENWWQSTCIRRALLEIYCGHWFWAVEKKVGCKMERQYALFLWAK